jgi:hypothetical protein
LRIDQETEKATKVHKDCTATDRQIDRQTYMHTDRQIDRTTISSVLVLRTLQVDYKYRLFIVQAYQTSQYAVPRGVCFKLVKFLSLKGCDCTSIYVV